MCCPISNRWSVFSRFCLQDEKNQLLVTNIWLKLVSINVPASIVSRHHWVRDGFCGKWFFESCGAGNDACNTRSPEGITRIAGISKSSRATMCFDFRHNTVIGRFKDDTVVACTLKTGRGRTPDVHAKRPVFSCSDSRFSTEDVHDWAVTYYIISSSTVWWNFVLVATIHLSDFRSVMGWLGWVTEDYRKTE